MEISTNILFLFLIIYLILDKLIFKDNTKKEADPNLVLQMQMMELMKTQMTMNNSITFEETKAIMSTMVDEYLENMYSIENERLHLIQDRDFPTSWEGVYVYPNLKTQEDQIKRLKQSIRVNSSESFMNRIRLFYSDAYINDYLDNMIEEKYYQRLTISEENSKIFRNTCRENLEKIRLEEDQKRKKEIAEKNKKINDLISAFSYKKYLPTDLETVEDTEFVDNIDTHKLLRGRYICKKTYYDNIEKNIKDESDIINKATQYDKVDDTLIAYLAREFGWNRMADTPLVTEKAKYDIADVCLRYNINPVEEELFGDHAEMASYEVTYKESTFELTGKRLNNIFFLSDTYNKNYKNMEEAAVSEEISTILV